MVKTKRDGRSIGDVCYKIYTCEGKFSCDTGNEVIDRSQPDAPPVALPIGPSTKIIFSGTLTKECKCLKSAMPDEWGGVGFPPITPADLDTSNVNSAWNKCDDVFKRTRHVACYPCGNVVTGHRVDKYGDEFSDMYEIREWVACLGKVGPKPVHWEMTLEEAIRELIFLSGNWGNDNLEFPIYTHDALYLGYQSNSGHNAAGGLALECGAEIRQSTEHGQSPQHQVAYCGKMDSDEAQEILDCMASKMCCSAGSRNGIIVAMDLLTERKGKSARPLMDDFNCKKTLVETTGPTTPG